MLFYVADCKLEYWFSFASLHLFSFMQLNYFQLELLLSMYAAVLFSFPFFSFLIHFKRGKIADY